MGTRSGITNSLMAALTSCRLWLIAPLYRCYVAEVCNWRNLCGCTSKMDPLRQRVSRWRWWGLSNHSCMNNGGLFHSAGCCWCASARNVCFCFANSGFVWLDLCPCAAQLWRFSTFQHFAETLKVKYVSWRTVDKRPCMYVWLWIQACNAYANY